MRFCLQTIDEIDPRKINRWDLVSGLIIDEQSNVNFFLCMVGLTDSLMTTQVFQIRWVTKFAKVCGIPPDRNIVGHTLYILYSLKKCNIIF